MSKSDLDRYTFRNDIGAAMSYASVLSKDVTLAPELPPMPKATTDKTIKKTCRQPINRTAVRVTAKAWEFHAQGDLFGTNKHKKRNKKMKSIKVDEGSTQTVGSMKNAIQVQTVNGQAMCRLEDVQNFVVSEIEREMNKVCPKFVVKAKGAREAIDEALHGIGADLELFRKRSKDHLEYLRASRFTYVSEIGQITNALGDVRQFFLDDKHESEVKRMEHFLDVCERLKNLKDSGFLDSVAETILNLNP